MGAEAMPWLSQLCYRTPEGSRTEKESPGQNLPLAGDTYSQVSLISPSLWIQFSWFPMVIVFKMTMSLKQNYISSPPRQTVGLLYWGYAWSGNIQTKSCKEPVCGKM